MQITIPYYNDNTRTSNSNIGMYLKYGPKYLYNILTGKIEGFQAKYLDVGTMIHMYILQKDEFWKHYEILDFETPGSKQQQLFAEVYSKSIEIEPNKRLIEAYKEAYSTKGKSDDKVLSEATEMAQKLKDYINYLEIGKTGKTVISWNDMNTLKQIESNLRSHKKANELLYNLPITSEEYNEFHINWEFNLSESKQKVLCKSLLDRLIIDHDNKTICLVDLKTTVSTAKFKDSLLEYDYYRQMSFYWAAIHWYFKYELDINIENYTYETYIIAIQNNGDNNVRVIRLDPKMIEERLSVIINTLREIEWHKENNLWDYYRAYYEGDGAETL